MLVCVLNGIFKPDTKASAKQINKKNNKQLETTLTKKKKTCKILKKNQYSKTVFKVKKKYKQNKWNK